MNVGVLGGAGFLGSHLVDELIERGHEVCVVDDLSSCWTEDVDDDGSFAIRAKFLGRYYEEGGEVHVPSRLTVNDLLPCEVIVDLALRHPLERELSLYRRALFRAWRGTEFVIDLLVRRKIQKVIVVGALEALDKDAKTPLAKHLRSYEEGLGYLHRPPHFDVEFVHLPELYGPRQIPETGWVAALLTDATMSTTEHFCNLGYVIDAAILLADRVEEKRSRMTTSLVVGAPAVSPDDVLAALTSMNLAGLVAEVEERVVKFGITMNFGGPPYLSLGQTSLEQGLRETIRFYEEVGDA